MGVDRQRLHSEISRVPVERLYEEPTNDGHSCTFTQGTSPTRGAVLPLAEPRLRASRTCTTYSTATS